MSMLRYPPNRMFKASKLRIYNKDVTGSVTTPFITYYKKRRSYDESFAFARSKLGFIKAACCKCHINTIIRFDEAGGEIAETIPSPSRFTDEEDISYFDEIPREIIFEICQYLNANDLCAFARTCHLFRRYSYDNQLWKNLCFKTWSNPNFMMVDIENSMITIHEWFNGVFNMTVETEHVSELLKENMWRLIYIALEIHDAIPSIVPGRGLISERGVECYPVNRTYQYTATTGTYKLVGVSSVSRIEHIVHDQIKAWHKLECINTRPMPIYDLRTYGLKMTRTVRGQYNNVGFLNRRGYFLKTDLNRKIHLAYRFFPSIRFRLFRQEDRVYLLCQDLLINTGLASHCYTMYEVIKTADAEPQPGISCLLSEPSTAENTRPSISSTADNGDAGSICNSLNPEVNLDSLQQQNSTETAAMNTSSSFDFTVHSDFDSQLVNPNSQCITADSILLGIPVFYSMSSSSVQQTDADNLMTRARSDRDVAVSESDSGVLTNRSNDQIANASNEQNDSDSENDSEGFGSSESNIRETSL